jgi:hypothetical protein
MTDNTSNPDRFARRPKAHHRSDSNRDDCREANYALSGLNAEDVVRQYRKVCGPL